MKKASLFDFSLYLVTDRALSMDRTTLEIIEAALRGGITCVQLREKTCPTREFIEEALKIKEVLGKHQIPLIINDRVDVAQAVEADGVHLGQNDMPLKMAKDIVKDTMIIGISAESIQDAMDAEIGGADYVGASPIFATPTKTDTAPALGLEGLREMRRAVNIPIVGIGGINRGNAEAMIHHGADGIAVVSAIVSAEDPERAAGELKEAIMRSRNNKAL